MSSWVLAFKSLKYKALNTFLSLLLLAFGLGLIMVLLVSKQQLEGAFTQNIKGIDMVVGAKGSPLQIILSSVYHIDAPTGNIALSEFEKLGKNPMVKKAIPLAYGDNYQGFRIVGTTPSYAQHYKTSLAQGRYFKNAFEVNLGAAVAQKTGLQIGDEFTGSHGFNPSSNDDHAHHPFKVTGIYKPSGTVIDQLILTPLASVWQVHDHGHDYAHEEEPKEITAGLLSFNSPMANLMLPRQVNEKTNMQAALPAIEINRLFTLGKTATQLLSALGVLLMLLAAISVFTALYQSLQSEEPQLAFLRAIGSPRLKIFTLILTKGILLALLGFTLALMFSQIALAAMAQFLENSYHYQLGSALLNLNTLYLFLATIGLGILAAIGPALRAYRINISKTLAHA